MNMGEIRIPYYWVDKWGNGYWTPKAKMREAGFRNIACGPDGPEAWAKAKIWADRLHAYRRGEDVEVEAWPVGSLGEAFARFKATAEWSRKAPRTREDWERGWAHIKPVFGDCAPATATLEGLSLWYSGDPNDPAVRGLLDTVGVREAHRAMKIWRALWQVAAALQYCDSGKDPSAGIRRVTPRGRKQRWSEGETVRLVKGAWRHGFHGLACIIAVAWDTQFSPVDARTLAAKHRAYDRRRLFFDLSEQGRAKTGKDAIGTLSLRTEALVRAYLAQTFGEIELHPDAVLFRNRSGAPYSKDTLGDDFRTVRALVFGPGEKRQLLDMRRSGTVEAVAGSVDPAALSKKMGNTIDQSRELQNTYLPNTVSVVRMVDKARIAGRRLMREG